jgi:hypothetical protein
MFTTVSLGLVAITANAIHISEAVLNKNGVKASPLVIDLSNTELEQLVSPDLED